MSKVHISELDAFTPQTNTITLSTLIFSSGYSYKVGFKVDNVYCQDRTAAERHLRLILDQLEEDTNTPPPPPTDSDDADTQL